MPQPIEIRIDPDNHLLKITFGLTGETVSVYLEHTEDPKDKTIKVFLMDDLDVDEEGFGKESYTTPVHIVI